MGGGKLGGGYIVLSGSCLCELCSLMNTINKKLCSIEESTKMGCVMRKPDFCICENKDADQLRGDRRKADQRLWFRYINSAFPLLPKSEISSL